MISAASYPPLQNRAGAGHPLFGTGKRKSIQKGGPPALPMSVISALLLLSPTLNASAQQMHEPQSSVIAVKAHVVEQKYCRGDSDTFSVSLAVELEIENSSKTPVYLLWPIVPWVGKVASSIEGAEAGKFMYEQTASHYPQEKTHFERLKLEAGKKVLRRSGYYLIARHDPAFALPKSVSAGTYGLVLVLRPEEEPPAELQGPGTLQSVTTDPFLIRIPSHPKLTVCEADSEAR